MVIALSPKGTALVDRLIPIARQLQDDAIAGISAKDLALVKRALRKMHENMAGG